MVYHCRIDASLNVKLKVLEIAELRLVDIKLSRLTLILQNNELFLCEIAKSILLMEHYYYRFNATTILFEIYSIIMFISA